jgi:Ca2+-transporting ATPase
MALCSDSQVREGELLGDPTEGALWVLAQKGGLAPETEQEHAPRIAEIPFDSVHKFMATFHLRGDHVEMFIKGAPGVLLEHAAHWLTQQGEAALDAATRDIVEAAVDGMAQRSLRVIAVARRIIPARDFDPAGDLAVWVGDWTFLGLAGLLDPPRPEAADAIALCRRGRRST